VYEFKLISFILLYLNDSGKMVVVLEV